MKRKKGMERQGNLYVCYNCREQSVFQDNDKVKCPVCGNEEQEGIVKYNIEYGSNYISILKGEQEILYWEEQEWIEDPQVVFSICHAIELVYQDKLGEFFLRKLANDINNHIQGKIKKRRVK